MATNTPSPLGIYRATAQDLKLKMLLYGDPGVGKTTLALTANDHPELAPALVLNFEGGLLSVVNRGDVDVINIQTIDDLENVFWYFAQENEAVSHFKTIVVDSGSELYNKALREVVNQNLGRRQNRKGDEDDFELEDYGKAGNVVFRLFSMFRDLPRHVIVTSHAKRIYPPNVDPSKNPNLEPREVRPSFSTTVAQRLVGIFDMVHYMYTADSVFAVDEENSRVETHRYLLPRAMGAYQAKTRGPNFAAALGDVVVDPTLPMLYDLLMATEGGKATNAALQDRERDQIETVAQAGQQVEAVFPEAFGQGTDVVEEELEEVTA